MYEMRLGDYQLPILPENFKEQLQLDHHRYDIVGLGERLSPGKEKRHTWTITSYFPAAGEVLPEVYKAYYEGLVHRDYAKGGAKPLEPVVFSLMRWLTDDTAVFNTIAEVLITSIEWEDRAGEPGDLYYSIKLTEYLPFGAKVVSRG